MADGTMVVCVIAAAFAGGWLGTRLTRDDYEAILLLPIYLVAARNRPNRWLTRRICRRLDAVPDLQEYARTDRRGAADR